MPYKEIRYQLGYKDMHLDKIAGFCYVPSSAIDSVDAIRYGINREKDCIKMYIDGKKEFIRTPNCFGESALTSFMKNILSKEYFNRINKYDYSQLNIPKMKKETLNKANKLCERVYDLKKFREKIVHSTTEYTDPETCIVLGTKSISHLEINEKYLPKDLIKTILSNIDKEIAVIEREIAKL